MKTAWSMLAVLVVVFTLSVQAEEKAKEVTLKGTITCAKCDLKLETKCATVIKVKEKGKDVVYYFDPAGHKANHKAICTEAKQGTVKGTVSKKGDKMIIKVSSLKFD
jgi:Family of unknown function (DUF6370)